MLGEGTPQSSPCPPHHWLIEDDPSTGQQRWSCARCGLVRQETPRPTEARRLANVSTLGRDEVALLDPID